ncbi:prophage CP4-57 regulatory family protein [Burkholderia pseudomallei MSHR5613]|uniref:helix-turn-helix transcriptional regulator n=2 Tax=Burkholderia pseudomallei TaxID=28450 RepID=UPI00053156EE|nr:AlpA family phage regulatory protein [Burkholderia pseudomallei]KGS39089.1 prophage CP4-57 regulatory family protein [Burkholderia pseudomallei MSHR5613]
MLNKNQTVAPEQPNPTHYSASDSASPMVRQREKALRILRMKQMRERTGLSRATLYVLMSTDPTFPAKINLTARTIGWLESEVDAWIASRAASRGVTQ